MTGGAIAGKSLDHAPLVQRLGQLLDGEHIALVAQRARAYAELGIALLGSVAQEGKQTAMARDDGLPIGQWHGGLLGRFLVYVDLGFLQVQKCWPRTLLLRTMKRVDIYSRGSRLARKCGQLEFLAIDAVVYRCLFF
jgi:hypothetical protein